MSRDLREAAATLCCVADDLARNLRDAATLNPSVFSQEGITQLLNKWRSANKVVRDLLAAPAVAETLTYEQVYPILDAYTRGKFSATRFVDYINAVLAAQAPNPAKDDIANEFNASQRHIEVMQAISRLKPASPPGATCPKCLCLMSQHLPECPQPNECESVAGKTTEAKTQGMDVKPPDSPQPASQVEGARADAFEDWWEAQDSGWVRGWASKEMAKVTWQAAEQGALRKAALVCKQPKIFTGEVSATRRQAWKECEDAILALAHPATPAEQPALCGKRFINQFGKPAICADRAGHVGTAHSCPEQPAQSKERLNLNRMCSECECVYGTHANWCNKGAK